MRDTGIILFWMSLAALLIFAWVMFPTLNVNVLIIHIPLIGWASWLYGRSGGLLVALLLQLFAAYLISFAYADIAEYFAAKASGTGIYIIAALMTGKLRSDHDKIKNANERLDHLVARRDQELSALTSRLLNTSEKRRARRGRELHDGIGQQLTGARLLSASLLDQLEKERYPGAEMAAALTKQINNTHDLIRRVARLLFPIRIHEVGLIPALMELAASIKEIKRIDITVNDRAGSPELPDAAALQLYRICQEITMHMIDHAHARRIRIILDKSPQELVLSIGHDGPLVPGETTTSIMQLIDYRLNQISGHPFPASSQDGLRNLSFAVPNPNPPTAL